MLARRTWLLIAGAVVLFSLWDAAQPIRIFEFVRYLGDGTKIESGITCGSAFPMVFAGEFDEDVPGRSTEAECLKAARTKVAEVVALWALALTAVVVGMRYGREPPAPIDRELPALPTELRRILTGRSRERR